MQGKTQFPELISSYIMELMNKRKENYGVSDPGYKALYYQYVQTEDEMKEMKECNAKHYEASMGIKSGLQYLERLYKRQATIDLTMVCNAHCRYCLRQNYDLYKMSESDMQEIVSYIAKDNFLKEILITGGDPLLVPEQLMRLMDMLIVQAPNIKIIRIGSRLPMHNPMNLSEELLNYFDKNKSKVKFELGIQVNHIIELQPETVECIKNIQRHGVQVYAQNVLLKNVNDSLEALIELYDTLRYLNIESHYLFHPVPMLRTAQFRMSLQDFLSLARQLTASGEIPGRSKPMFTLMTDVGKCTLYAGMLREKDKNGYYDIYTGYKLQERQKWHEGYQLPESALVDAEGYIHVKYLDGGN